MKETAPPVEGKTIAIVSYFTIFGTVIAIILNLEKKAPFASFHIRQALGLWLLFFALGYSIGLLDSWHATLSFWIFFSILFVYALINAMAAKAIPIPLVGKIFQNLFASLIK